MASTAAGTHDTQPSGAPSIPARTSSAQPSSVPPTSHSAQGPQATHGHSFLSAHLLEQIRSPHTVSSAAAQKPTAPIHEICEFLYGKRHHVHHSRSAEDAKEGNQGQGTMDKLLEKMHLKKEETAADPDPAVHDKLGDDKDRKNPAADQWNAMRPLSPAELEEVAGTANWGEKKPGALFLNTLISIEDYALNGLCSPPLMGGSGVMPLSIISVIPDIIQHHADIIVRAEFEIFLATNYWEASGAAQTIVDAMRELSRRVVEGKRKKVVVKLMYDRGNPSQVINPHQPVDAKTYTGDKVKLPSPEEIPGIDMEVQNYHEPPVGTFHAKYMIVDRKIAILNSNNIQDRVNVEMMTHIEGPIVQSFYDMALISWYNIMKPPLPLLTTPPNYASPLKAGSFTWGRSHPLIESKGDLEGAGAKSRQTLAEHHAQTEEASDDQTMEKKKEVWDNTNADEAERVDAQFSTEGSITQHLNTGKKIESTDNDPPPNAAAFTPIVLHSEHDPVPMAMVCRPPRGKPGHADTFVPQDQAFLAGFRFSQKSVFIQTPTFNATPVVEAALEAVRRGVLVEIYADLGFNDEGELLPFQGGTNEMVATFMYEHLTEAEKANLKIHWYTGKDQKTPLNAKEKSRNCHVKLMIVDEEVIIQGNGNQDTQSWFHSQEVNAMIESALLSSEIRQAIDANQNTKYYGLVDPKDGVWRDKNGQTLPGQKPPPKGPFKSLVGVKGAIQRVRGEGGF